MNYKNKNIIVIGGSSGIGRGIASSYIEKGAKTKFTEKTLTIGADKNKLVPTTTTQQDINLKAEQLKFRVKSILRDCPSSIS